MVQIHVVNLFFDHVGRLMLYIACLETTLKKVNKRVLLEVGSGAF
jgi:hypothetical protein